MYVKYRQQCDITFLLKLWRGLTPNLITICLAFSSWGCKIIFETFLCVSLTMFCRRPWKLPSRFLDSSSCMCSSSRSFETFLSFCPTGHGKWLALVFFCFTHSLMHVITVIIRNRIHKFYFLIFLIFASVFACWWYRRIYDIDH